MPWPGIPEEESWIPEEESWCSHCSKRIKHDQWVISPPPVWYAVDDSPPKYGGHKPMDPLSLMVQEARDEQGS